MTGFSYNTSQQQSDKVSNLQDGTAHAKRWDVSVAPGDSWPSNQNNSLIVSVVLIDPVTEAETPADLTAGTLIGAIHKPGSDRTPVAALDLEKVAGSADKFSIRLKASESAKRALRSYEWYVGIRWDAENQNTLFSGVFGPGTQPSVSD